MFFITQLAEKGNLHDVVTKESPPFKQRVQYMRDVARGNLFSTSSISHLLFTRNELSTSKHTTHCASGFKVDEHSCMYLLLLGC